MPSRSTPWDMDRVATAEAVGERAERVVPSTGLAQLGSKVDLEAVIEAVSTLGDVLVARRNYRPARLPESLSMPQRQELRVFIVHALRDGTTSASGDDVWSAIAPGGAAAGDPGRVPTDAADRLLERVDETLDALAYFDRLRG